MKKVMISQPMNGLDDRELLEIKNRAYTFLHSRGYDVIESFLEEPDPPISVKNYPLYFLSKSIEVMSRCDAVYFCKGWENARGCAAKHDIAEKYGLELLYEE